MKIRRFLAYLLVSSCIAVVVLFVAALILASISLQNDPWLESDIRIWQAAHDDLPHCLTSSLSQSKTTAVSSCTMLGCPISLPPFPPPSPTC